MISSTFWSALPLAERNIIQNFFFFFIIFVHFEILQQRNYCNCRRSFWHAHFRVAICANVRAQPYARINFFVLHIHISRRIWASRSITCMRMRTRKRMRIPASPPCFLERHTQRGTPPTDVRNSWRVMTYFQIFQVGEKMLFSSFFFFCFVLRKMLMFKLLINE